MKRLLLTLAIAGLFTSPAFAAQPPCRGEACAQVTPVIVQGCWAYHNSSRQRVRGIISVVEIVLFEIAPGGTTTPRFKNGVCLRDARPYQVDFNANRVGRGAPRHRGGGH